MALLVPRRVKYITKTLLFVKNNLLRGSFLMYLTFEKFSFSLERSVI
jgi:hypothetical protein